MKIQKCLLLILICSFANITYSQNISQNSLVQDVRQLAKILEKSHPDPYIKGGGKIAYHKRLHKLMLSIPGDGMTKEEFQKLLLPFVASVGDGHTRIHVDYRKNEKRPGGIPLYFRIVEKSLFVSGVIDENHKNLIGSLLLSVEDISFKELYERVTRLRGTDNEYGALALLEAENYLWYESQFAELIPEWTKDNITVELKLPSGEIEKITFNVPVFIDKPLYKVESGIEIPPTDKSEFTYDFVDENRKIAILKVDGMGGFRENFELVGLESQFQLDGAKYFYRRYNEKAPPNDKSELLEGIPSATEVFKSLVIEMKDSKSEALIIDLRGNGGGNSTLGHFLIYFLYGKDRLVNYFSIPSAPDVVKYSELYFEQNNEIKLEDVNKDRIVKLNVNDYWFEELYNNETEADTSPKYRELDELYQNIPTFYCEYKSNQNSEYYRPKKVIVLSSPKTYSSGYTMMKMLNVMGATLVGTPSSQAENAPGWILNYKLSNSELTGWVACKFYTSFSNRIKNGVYQLDHELTYNMLKKYNFDPNSEILFTLNLLKD